MPLTSFTNGAVADANDVNANFALCVLTDTARTIAVTHDWNAPQDFAPGTVALPGIYLNGDVDTGIYQPAADEWAVAVAGVKRLGAKAAGVDVIGALTVSSGATISAGGLTITAGGLTVTAGTTSLQALTVNGAATLKGNISHLAQQTYNTVLGLTHEFGAQNSDGVDGSEPYRYRWGFAGEAIADGGTALVLTQIVSAPGTNREVFRVNQSGQVLAPRGLGWGGGAVIGTSDDVVLDGAAVVLTGSLAWGGGAAIASSDNIFSGVLQASLTWDPPSIAANTQTSTTVAVAGAAVGDAVALSNPWLVDNIYLEVQAYVSAAGTVTVTMLNQSSSAIDPASRTTKIFVLQ